jgi:type IV fimbrial biogenesis protein FimT
MKLHITRSAPTGLTLIELMVTLSVLAILAAIGVPSLTDIIRSNRVSSQTNELLAVFHLSRNEAIRRNPPEDQFVLVDLTPDSNGWSAFVRPPLVLQGDDAPPMGCPVGTIRCLTRQNVTLSGPAQIRFNNRGYLVAATGDLLPQGAAFDLRHINTADNRHARCVSIRATGQVATTLGICP